MRPYLKSLLRINFVLLCCVANTVGQTLKKIDGTKVSADSLDAKIKYLMKAANVLGVAISVFNNNAPIFSKTYGLAKVQKTLHSNHRL